jgi:hypothetical protein
MKLRSRAGLKRFFAEIESQPWSLTGLREKLIIVCTKVVTSGSTAWPTSSEASRPAASMSTRVIAA